MRTVLLFFVLLAGPSVAQVVVPTNPTKFGKRTISGGANTGNAEVNATAPAAGAKARVVSYFSLESPRQWKSKDGKSLLGSIIAYEESVLEVSGANASAAATNAQNAAAPKTPEKLTIIRDGKVRLLVNQKPFEVPLERLCDEDREHAMKLHEAVTKQQAAK
jgi:hypothetical protein